MIIRVLLDKLKIYRVSWIVWLSLIAVLSFLPGNQLPEIHWDLISIDKLVHFLMYFILSFFMILDFSKSKLNQFNIKVYLSIILVGISFGFFVELIQGFFVYQRFFDSFDIIANSFGTIIGATMTPLIGRKFLLINKG